MADTFVQIFIVRLNWALEAIDETVFEQYNKFWERGLGFDDIISVDLRWLSLQFIVLAFGVLLDPSPKVQVKWPTEKSTP